MTGLFSIALGALTFIILRFGLNVPLGWTFVGCLLVGFLWGAR